MRFQDLIKNKEGKEYDTFDKLYKENIELDEKIKELSEQEKNTQKELIVVLNKLNNIQSKIRKTDDLFDENCFKLQEYGKK